MFIAAMRRAKSLEVGATEAHLDGWDYLTSLGDELVQRGCSLASPQEFFDLVKETFTFFSMEHRDAINDARDVTDYPMFDNLTDADEVIAPALSMLTKGNVMCKQVDKIASANKLALITPAPNGKGGRKRGMRPSPTSSTSSSSPSPVSSKRERKRIARQKRQADAKRAAALAQNPPPASGPAPAPAPAPNPNPGARKTAAVIQEEIS
jgi:hypothetical protein